MLTLSSRYLLLLLDTAHPSHCLHSFSGKTTLLHVLGGRNRFDGVKTVEIDGSVLVNGKPVDVDALGMNQDHRMAFLAQEDHSLIGVTAREAIRFSARLRLPRKVTETQILDLVEDILDDLGLLKLADRPLFSLTSLSGGERRRVALGIELVTRPSILLLDEVTSGKQIKTIPMSSSTCYFPIDSRALSNVHRSRHTQRR